MNLSEIFTISEDIKGHTLILPAISVSNVGQLAVDLLIQSSSAKKICNIWSDAFIPLIGADPFHDQSSDLCTEFEVYQLKQQAVLIFQFRSPIWQNKIEEFLDCLVKLFQGLEVKSVVILSSLFDHERIDCQLKDSTVRCCLCPISQPVHLPTLRKLQCKFLENKDGTETSGVMTKDLFLPGAGFTKDLHLKCINSKLPCVSLLKFCSDGDNTPEALELAKVVDGWLNIVPIGAGSTKTFVQPHSWKFIYGGPSPVELFP